ncbi:gibberellin 3-beta-dioxygenase 1 [Malania oleifera]|uniref:gibberellin 3-beta-dioxygenase 1 n=1 Tax=Malania oleifera TaxID=397392 RepID=UPI0025AE4F6C|nr:gibberellin 3-beta-dioxygenase 1 [Malania oleifera]
MPSRLSDAYKAHPLRLTHEVVDLGSVIQLPDSHAWNAGDGHPSVNGRSCTEPGLLPIIDLAAANALELLGHACRTWGVFQVTNHGVPSSLFDEMEAAGVDLFSLPLEQKMKAARAPDSATGYGLARISSFFSKQMWYEGFTIVGSPLQHARQLWPRHRDFSKFCEAVEEYDEKMNQLAARLLWLMLGALGITKHDVKWAGPKRDFKGASAALQLNCYPACPEPERAMGLAAHTDSTLLTILYQNRISGLQVFREGTGWAAVPPVPGALVVNVGDLLHIISNGSYPSVLHRAVVNRTQQRLSFAYLYGPPTAAKIEPHRRMVGPSDPPLYRAVYWSEYLGLKARLFNKALSSVRLVKSGNDSTETEMKEIKHSKKGG